MYANHAPVMEEEALAALCPINKGVYVDATFGGGGYTRAILGAADCAVCGFDRDSQAIERAAPWARGYGGRLTLINRPFAQMAEALEEVGVSSVNGVVFDLGVSSMQLDEAARGFSFRYDGPLSMRMDGARPDARDVVNEGEAGDLAAIFKAYGEERHAKKIARAIVAARDAAPIETTGRLAEIVAAAAPARPTDKIHPATRVFQALRIFVNDELGQLVRALTAAEQLLAPAGRLVVVTFHSLEDRIVKRFFADRSGTSGAPSRHAPAVISPAPVTFRRLTSKAQAPSEGEIEENPRARSAKLRAGVRLDVAPLDPSHKDFLAGFAPAPLHLSKALSKWSAAL